MKRTESPDENPIKMYCNTAVQFFTQTAAYVPGQVGQTKTWTKFTSAIGDKTLDVFWADWRGSFGSQQLQAMSMGVHDMCTLLMDYHPELYELLRTKTVLIVKNANADAVIEVEPDEPDPAEQPAAAENTPAENVQTENTSEENTAADSAPAEYMPIRNHPDVYTVWGAVNDVRSMHRIMEFKVRRFEQK